MIFKHLPFFYWSCNLYRTITNFSYSSQLFLQFITQILLEFRIDFQSIDKSTWNLQIYLQIEINQKFLMDLRRLFETISKVNLNFKLNNNKTNLTYDIEL